jgi:hypothetical protein
VSETANKGKKAITVNYHLRKLLFPIVLISFFSSFAQKQINDNFYFTDGVYLSFRDFVTDKPVYKLSEVFITEHEESSIQENNCGDCKLIRKIKITNSKDSLIEELDLKTVWGISIDGNPYVNEKTFNNFNIGIPILKPISVFTKIYTIGSVCFFIAKKFRPQQLTLLPGIPSTISTINAGPIVKSGNKKIINLKTGEILDANSFNLLSCLFSFGGDEDIIKKIIEDKEADKKILYYINQFNSKHPFYFNNIDSIQSDSILLSAVNFESGIYMSIDEFLKNEPSINSSQVEIFQENIDLTFRNIWIRHNADSLNIDLAKIWGLAIDGSFYLNNGCLLESKNIIKGRFSRIDFIGSVCLMSISIVDIEYFKENFYKTLDNEKIDLFYKSVYSPLSEITYKYNSQKPYESNLHWRMDNNEGYNFNAILDLKTQKVYEYNVYNVFRCINEDKDLIIEINNDKEYKRKIPLYILKYNRRNPFYLKD